MRSSATRLTLYALISAMECDLRHIIRTGLRDKMPLDDLLGKELMRRAIDRLERMEGRNTSTSNSLDTLLYYIDFGDLYQIINRYSSFYTQEFAEFIKNLTPKFLIAAFSTGQK